MKFSKVRDVKSPFRAHAFDAGIDFFVPTFDSRFISDLLEKNNEIDLIDGKIRVGSLCKVLIPSGIKVNVPEGFALIAFNKSGIASKKGLDVLACVIDSGYQGEVHISLVNSSKDPVYIHEGEKIIQFVLLPLGDPSLAEVDLEDLYIEESTRSTGGFGSTGV